MSARGGLLVAAMVGTGVVAGVFFGFSSFVMPALGRLPAREGASAMQVINVAAVNGWFMAVLFGSGVVALGLSATALGALGDTSTRWTLVGTTLYAAGVLGVTIVANVPRNEALAVMAPDLAASYFPRYVSEWIRWNHVRTVCSAVAMACFALARS